MPIHMITPEELLECEKIQSIAFVSSLDIEQLKKRLAEEGPPPDRYIGYFNEENVLTACMELPEYEVLYDGQWVGMVGLGGVASLPEYRRGGAIRQIVNTALREMYAGGTLFSCLYPFSHAYYRQFGYELCQLSPEYGLSIEALSHFQCEAKVRMLQPGEKIEELQAVFERFFSGCNLPVRRQERHWKHLTGSDPYKERRYTYLLEDEEGPSAYVVFTPQGDDNNRVCRVYEMAFTSPKGLSDVLGFLYRLSAQYTKVRLSLPEGIPLPALMRESYEVKLGLFSHQMTRVVHLQQALQKKRHPDGAEYTVRVRDAVIPENDGVFHVRCQSGAVSAAKLPDTADADLTADVRAMTQLLLGFLSLDEALYRPDVQAASSLQTLRSVFIKRPVFLTDHF